MIFSNKAMLDRVVELERPRVLKNAREFLGKKPINLAEVTSNLSKGTKNDYFSQSDYWWPNPATTDNLPWVRRDGESNPANFYEHRKLLRRMRKIVCALASAYYLTGEEKYAQHAVLFLKGWFLDPATRMNPSLHYSQVVLGLFDNNGRPGGLIDTLHLIEIPLAIRILEKSAALTGEILNGLKNWFNSYVDFLTTSELGIAEREHINNHGVAWCVQTSLYASLAGRQDVQKLCVRRFKEVFLVKSMKPDGTFPEEIARTKPYNYSLFVMDLMAILAFILSSKEDNLFEYTTKDGRSMQTGLDFIFPLTKDKSKWPFHKDVEHFDAYPTRQMYLLFSAFAKNEHKYLDLWMGFDPDPTDIEVRRNLPMREPLLWLV